jgi:multiple sugar transport system substrate-binding protein
VVGAVASAGGIVGLTANASAKATAHTAADPVTLQFWSSYNVADKEESTFENVVIKKFEQENPNIKVVATSYNDADLLQKYISAAAAGDAPDVMRSDIAFVPELASQGLIEKVSGLPRWPAIKKNTLPGPLKTEYVAQASSPGYYALPDDTNTQALFWNKTDFKAAGIKGPPKTLAQMYADAKKLTVPAKQQYGLGVDGRDPWNVGPYVWSAGGSFANGKSTTASGHLDSKATTAAVTSLVNLLKAGDIGSDFQGGASAVSGEQGFPKGQYAMYIDGPWAVPTYAALKPKPKYGIALFPSGKGGSVSTVGGEDLVISQESANKAAAEKFAQWLDTSFPQKTMAAQGDMSSEISDAAAEVRKTPYLKIFAKQLKTAQVRPVNAGYSKMDSAFQDDLGAILAGKMSVSAGLKQATAQANSAFSGSGTP